MIRIIIKGILISLAISVDAFTVAMVEGLHIHGKHRTRQLFQLAFFFCVTNVAIFIIGYLLGASIASTFDSIDHWVAFGLLLLVALHMLYDVIFSKKNTKETPVMRKRDSSSEVQKKFNSRRILLLSLAIGVDAFAVGLSYSLSGDPLWLHSFIFFLVTFIVCFVGGWLGGLIKQRYVKIAEVVGAIVLVLIGISILIEHTSPDREIMTPQTEIHPVQSYQMDINKDQ